MSNAIIKKGVGQKYTETEKQAILFAAKGLTRDHGQLSHFLKEVGLTYPTFKRWTGKGAKQLPRWRWKKTMKAITKSRPLEVAVEG